MTMNDGDFLYKARSFLDKLLRLKASNSDKINATKFSSKLNQTNPIKTTMLDATKKFAKLLRFSNDLSEEKAVDRVQTDKPIESDIGDLILDLLIIYVLLQDQKIEEKRLR